MRAASLSALLLLLCAAVAFCSSGQVVGQVRTYPVESRAVRVAKRQAPSYINITGWDTPAQAASQIAAALVDARYWVVENASVATANVNAIGVATFAYLGSNSTSLGSHAAGIAPGHFLAPLFRNGSVMLATAAVVGSPPPRLLTVLPPGAEATAAQLPGSKRGVKVVLSLRARAAGLLRPFTWAWSDATFDVWQRREEVPVASANTFRIIINGAGGVR
jgi:hypothetical protein